MKTEKQVIKENRKRKLAGGIALKLILVMLSFVQAHWVPIACAAGTVAAATMFGDKAYWTNIGKETEKFISGKKPHEAVAFIEAEIAKYPKWREENLDKVSSTDPKINDLYFHLAKAKEAAGAPTGELMKDYKKAVFSSNGGNAFVWLYKNLTSQEYAELVKARIKNTTTDNTKKAYIPYSIAGQFEKEQSWPAFKTFLEIVLNESNEPAKDAKAFEGALDKNGAWMKEYKDYCKSRPDLLEYVLEKDYKLVKECIKQENFTQAAEIYEGILKAVGSRKDVSQLKLDICQTVFNAGRYEEAISKLSSYIPEYKATHRALVKEATLMRGRAYIQLGQIDKATDEFLALMIEYPETKEAPEANFFIGYCYMLQNKFEQAKLALNLVAKDFPDSTYAGKAKLCLTRIESMAK